MLFLSETHAIYLSVLLALFYLQSFGTVTAGTYKVHQPFSNFLFPQHDYGVLRVKFTFTLDLTSSHVHTT